MPFALILVGILLVVAAVRDRVSDGTNGTGLFTLVKGDFTGPNNYTYWLASILLIGAIGYIPAMRPLSRIFLVLLVVVLVVSHGGLFDKLNAQLFGGSLGSGTVSVNPSVFGAGSIASGNQ